MYPQNRVIGGGYDDWYEIRKPWSVIALLFVWFHSRNFEQQKRTIQFDGWSICCHGFGIQILNLIFSFPHNLPPSWGDRKHSLTLMYSNRPYSGSQLVINASIVALHPCASYCKHITSDFAQEPALHKHLFRRLAEANESTVHSLIACPGPAVISLKWNIWQPICWLTGFIVGAAFLDTRDKLKSIFFAATTSGSHCHRHPVSA